MAVIEATLEHYHEVSRVGVYIKGQMLSLSKKRRLQRMAGKMLRINIKLKVWKETV